MYSVQQIKFDCLAYIKEFGAEPAEWNAGACRDPKLWLNGDAVDAERDIWLWKPAVSPVAARTVLRFLAERMGVRMTAADEPDGACVFLYRKRDGA